MAKGSEFERWVCRRLSDWWSGTADGDVLFWRTAGSGGRATTRSRQSKATARNHCGDVAAIDPAGEDLIRLVTWELKRGYNTATIHSVLDRRDDAADQQYDLWVAQAARSAAQAGTPFWAVVHRRDNRDALLTFPTRLLSVLGLALEQIDSPMLLVRSSRLRCFSTTCCRFDDFLDSVSPDRVRRAVASLCSG